MDNIVTEKRCTKCGNTGLFYTDKRRPDGLKCWCKKCFLESSQKYNHQHPEKLAESSRKYKATHPEKIRKWQIDNPEKSRKADQKWRKNHPEQCLEKVRKWAKANPEKTREYNRNRRARIDGNGGKITAQEWVDLKEKYNNTCLCCGRSDVEMTLDHVVPLILGGKNVIENAQPLCKSCNCKKHSKHIDYR